MNYSAKASTKHLLNRVGSRPKINYSRFNLKEKKSIKESFMTQKNNTETSTITQLFTFKKIYPDIQKSKPTCQIEKEKNSCIKNGRAKSEINSNIITPKKKENSFEQSIEYTDNIQRRLTQFEKIVKYLHGQNSQLIDYKIMTIFNSIMKKDVQNNNLENRINELKSKCDSVVKENEEIKQLIKSKVDNLSHLCKNVLFRGIQKNNKILGKQRNIINNHHSELLRLDTLDLIDSCNDNRLITKLVYYQPKIKYTHISKQTKNVPKLNLVR